MDLLERYHADAFVGLLVLLFIAATKYSSHRAARRATWTRGRVEKVLRHTRFTAYYFSYQHEGRSRTCVHSATAPGCAPDLGDEVDILVNSAESPDVPIPSDNVQVVPGVGTSTCWLRAPTGVTGWELFYGSVAVALIIRSFCF